MAEAVRRIIRRKPRPSVRMRELLTDAKLAGATDFDAAWEQAWAQMTSEKAWPHSTTERREWKVALRGTKPEFRRCFEGTPTPFGGSALMLLAWQDPEELAGDEHMVIALALA